MILCISTSSPTISVAWFDVRGHLISQDEKLAPRKASETVLELTASLDLAAVTLFVADIGPGSFTGVRVGVTMVKMWGNVLSAPVAGITSFDLVSGSRAVAIASRAGEVYYREPGQAPEIRKGENMPHEEPRASMMTLELLLTSTPLELMPCYVAAPSVSQPKQKHIMGETLG